MIVSSILRLCFFRDEIFLMKDAFPEKAKRIKNVSRPLSFSTINASKTLYLKLLSASPSFSNTSKTVKSLVIARRS
jgi:hypothetical protein